jgi:hypothetical protein
MWGSPRITLCWETRRDAALRRPSLHGKKGRAEARPRPRRNKLNKATMFTKDNLETRLDSQRPKPADCIDCREISEVDAIPCIRNLNSSAFDALSSAVS